MFSTVPIEGKRKTHRCCAKKEEQEGEFQMKEEVVETHRTGMGTPCLEAR